jgi:thioredoxin 1
MIVNKANYQKEVIEYDGTVIVDFYADWCGPCKMIAPILDEIVSENSEIKLCKVNCDTDGELAMGFGIASIPTLLIYKGGEVTSRVVGYRTKDEILKLI